MDRREQLFNANREQTDDADLIDTHVNFQFRKEDPRRKKGELRALSVDEKALCALRKVLADMSANAGGKQRYFIASPQCRILDRHVSPGAKEGDPGSYRVKGRCQIGITHAGGEASHKMAEFTLSFRDTEDAMGLPDVQYEHPTTVDLLDPRAAL